MNGTLLKRRDFHGDRFQCRRSNLGMGPIKIGVVRAITSDPFEYTPHAKSSNQQSSRSKIRRFVDSTSFDNRNESAPRKRSKVLKVINGLGGIEQ
jgi:hypothetical protein